MSAWTGKVCVVTGASSGIGRRTAVDLARAGARVCVAARREERLRALVDEIGGEKAGHRAVATDVSRREDIAALAAQVADAYGRCDVLINNAGIPGGYAAFDGSDETLANVERVMRVNFFAAVYATAEFLGLLERSAPSHIVNVTSVAGRIAAPGIPAYTASKFALVGWTESAAPDLARRGIHLHSVEPGFVPTEGFPQKELVSDPMLKRVLGTEAQVSAAIRAAVEKRKLQRTVPRWYYAFQVPRILAPPLFRAVLGKAASARGPRTD